MASEAHRVPVAVLSDRHDLDLVISTWMAGFTACRFTDLHAALGFVAKRGVILVDEGRLDEVLSAVRSRRSSAAVVGLSREAAAVTVDLERGIVMAGVLTVPELAHALEQALGLAPHAATVSAELEPLFGPRQHAELQRTRGDGLWTATLPPG